MGDTEEIRDFLTTRRARITPEGAGIATYGRRKRRVPGLRRDEVALLAGVSVEWYTRLERGNARGVSDDVLHAVVGALQLDEAERAHLTDLVRRANDARPPRRAPGPQRVRPSVQRIVDALSPMPACIINGRHDVLHANDLAQALYSEAFRDTVRPVNLVRFLFLDARSKSFFRAWDTVADDTTAMLRTEAGRNPYDRALSDLIGLLSTRSDEFRTRWGAHDVRLHRTGAKQLHHPLVGDLTLTFEILDLPADPGLALLTYSAEPGSRSEEAMRELVRWSEQRTHAVSGGG